MIRKLTVTAIILTLLSPFSVTAVTQGTDEVTLSKPSQGAEVSGSYTVEWKIVDSEVSDPAYFIDIFNLSCEQSGGNIGRLMSSGASKDGDNYSYQWDTSSGEIVSSLQNQGNYCMRVCSILAEGGSVYSLCDKQSFVFGSGGQTQDNKPPVIADSKESFDTTLNQVFTHKVTAEDPDNDKLTFSLVSSPSFLSINSATGEVTGKSTEVGNIKFIVKVDDGKGGVATQEYVLNVEIPGAKKEVEFIFPQSGSVVSGDTNKIEWEVSSNVQVRSVVLNYSQNRSDWTELARLDRNTRSYEWNIENVEPGDYYLKIQVTDNSNKLYEMISEKFSVSDAISVNQTEITDLEPSEGSVLNGKRPVISAKFNTPDGTTIATSDVKFMLNDRIDLTVCDVTGTSISCSVTSELADGQYRAYVELLDSNGSTIVKEWPFTIQSGGSGGLSIPSGNILQLVIIILAVGFLLIALPWSLYFFLKRRKNAQSVVHVPQQPSSGDVIQPVAVDAQDPSTVTAQPVNTAPVMETDPIANSSVDLSPATPGLVQTVSPASDQTGHVQTDLANPQQPNIVGDQTINPQALNTPQVNSLPNNSQASPQPIPYSEEALRSHQASTSAGQESAQTDIAPQSVNIADAPAPVSQPAMYSQDEIPAWMQVSNEEARPSGGEPTTSVAEEIVTKADVLEGAKVYDPYGIALNSDEVQSNHHN